MMKPVQEVTALRPGSSRNNVSAGQHGTREEGQSCFGTVLGQFRVHLLLELVGFAWKNSLSFTFSSDLRIFKMVFRESFNLVLSF